MVEVDATNVSIVATANQFSYNNKFVCAPELFACPRETTDLNSWQIWLCGYVVVHDGICYKI
jgi:hypothetical protein